MKGTHDLLQVFLKRLNKQHATIKFDCKILTEKIAFIDTKIYINDIKCIRTAIYRKETDCQSFLHSKPEHPLVSKLYDLTHLLNRYRILKRVRKTNGKIY